jgi:hypothetical protein
MIIQRVSDKAEPVEGAVAQLPSKAEATTVKAEELRMALIMHRTTDHLINRPVSFHSSSVARTS